MITTDPSSSKRARQILREWRRRGVKRGRCFHCNTDEIANVTCCTPADSVSPVEPDEIIFSIPTLDELPESDLLIDDSMPVTDAESIMAAAIDDFWDDPTVPRDDG